jgi:hypothetical protein
MKKGITVPPGVTVLVIVVVVALIGYFGYKAAFPPQRVQMSSKAMEGMKAHMSQSSGGGPRRPGMAGGQSPP